MTTGTLKPPPTVRSPRGTQLSCRGWHQEAALRMLMNSLDPEVAEKPEELIVYGGSGRAARNWACFETIVRELQQLGNDETLLVQSGKPVGVFRTHEFAPRVLIANANLVGYWSNWEHFHELERAGLIMYGQMSAGSWIHVGAQGILQGTYETFAAAADKHFSGDLSGKLVVSGGMGGMGGAQPLAATLNGATFLGVEVDPERVKRRLRVGYCDIMVHNLDEAVRILKRAVRKKEATSVVLVGKLRRGHPGTGPPRHRSRPAHRPDQRPRSPQRLHPGRLLARAGRRAAPERSRRVPEAQHGLDRAPCRGHPCLAEARRCGLRLRQ